jgi:hypothetical protein
MLFIDEATTSFIWFTVLVITNYLTIIIYNAFNNQAKKNKLEISSKNQAGLEYSTTFKN